MSQGNLLSRVIGWLDECGIRYMVVGSHASSFHGEPRTTRDVDIVIDPDAEALRRFVRLLPASDFYADADAAAEAIERRTSFNIIEKESGWKVDLLIRRDRPFSRTELERRLSVRLLGTDAYIATVEDTILAKLEWALQGESERQLRDVAAMLAVNGRGLDREYIDGWIRELGLEEVWARAEALARGNS